MNKPLYVCFGKRVPTAGILLFPEGFTLYPLIITPGWYRIEQVKRLPKRFQEVNQHEMGRGKKEGK